MVRVEQLMVDLTHPNAKQIGQIDPVGEHYEGKILGVKVRGVRTGTVIRLMVADVVKARETEKRLKARIQGLQSAARPDRQGWK